MSWSPCPDPVPGDRASAEAIEMLIIPRAVDLGEMQVRRALPSAKRQMVGPFIFFDQMGPAEFLTDQGIDVRPHPHINLATVTYLFEGQILHRDSLGTEKTIEPGAVNWMRAGRGIVHSERTSPERKRNGQRLLNPDLDGIARRAGGKRPSIYSSRTGRTADRGRGRHQGAPHRRQRVWKSSPLKTPSETLYADVHLTAGAQLPIDPSYDERALYTIAGEIEVAGDVFGPGQLLVLRPGDPIAVRATGAARFMLFGGAPMEGPGYIWWNFVSSRPERIEQAKEEWARGCFDTVPGDAEEFIPLPQTQDKPRRATGGVYYP